MKKQLMIFIWISLVILLTSCQSHKDQVTMMVPMGSPQLAQLYMQDDPYYKVDVVSGSDPLISAFASKSHDVIIAPINLGAKLYQSGSPYVLLSVITWGNLYLASHGQDLNDIQDVFGKTIIAFGRNQAPDIVLKHILSQLNISATITYVDSLVNATGYLANQSENIILTAEPNISALLSQNNQISTLDLQSIYASIEHESSYPQAALFIKKTLDEDTILKVLKDIEDSIHSVNLNPENAATKALKLGINLPLQVLIESIPRSHIMFKNAEASKSSVLTFLAIFNVIEPFVFNGWLPDDDFFYV